MNVTYSIIIHIFWFFATYFVVVSTLFWINHKNSLFKDDLKKPRKWPFVSFVISAFNEEKSIQMTLKSLYALNYPQDKYEIIVLNDGSKDKTSQKVHAMPKDKRLTFIDNKNNKGKANCLNQGINLAKGEFIVCMDADSIVEKDILIKTIPMFNNKKVGSVTMAVRVLNNNKFLTRLIELEYIIGLSLLLKVFSKIRAIYVTPGPCSLYRASVLKEIGGFDPNNITEDHEIALNIIKHGYLIENTMNAEVFTTSPDTFKSLYVQRKRWYTGSLLTFVQHKDMMLKPKYGLIGFLLPYNYSLILAGFVMVGVSLYLILKNTYNSLSSYYLTNFNFFAHWNPIKNFDIYNYGQVEILSILSLVITFAILFIGLKLTKTSIRKKLKAIIFFPLLFFMYQIFWFVSYYNAIVGRKVKWR